MTTILCIQNPALPAQIKNFTFTSVVDACQAGNSLELALKEYGLMNREMPLIFVKDKDTIALSGGNWYYGENLEDNRVIPGNKDFPVEVIADTKTGKKILSKLPMWAFTWGNFLKGY